MNQWSPSPYLIALCIYLLYAVTLTLSPFQFTEVPVWSMSIFSSVSSQGIDTADIVLNIMGFALFGFIMYSLTSGKNRVLKRLCVTVCYACLLSVTIEFLQGYIPTRDASLTDVVTNTVGGGLGFGLGFYVHQKSWYSEVMVFMDRTVKNKLALFGFAIYAAILVVFMVNAVPKGLVGWDKGFPLLIGNEATLDRPWLGSIFSLLVFDRGLQHEEIHAIYANGPRPNSSAVQGYQPILSYLFDEGSGGMVYDQSHLGGPIDLQIMSPDSAAWLPGGGLTLRGPTVLRSVRSSERIYRQITATDRFSIATWFQPATLDQYGPARIVSFSESPWVRNFTIGQEGESLHFRVRNLFSGRNGIKWDLQASALQSVTEPTHAVLIYDKGIKSLYVNSEKVYEVHPPDGLTLIARFLHFDSDSHWQRWMVVCLLVGGAGVLLSPLAISRIQDTMP